MEIQAKENGYYVGDASEPKAEIHVVPTGETKWIIDHTYVSDELRGQGIGEQLVLRVVEAARKEGRTIIPLCPFAKAQFDRHEDYQDVL